MIPADLAVRQKSDSPGRGKTRHQKVKAVSEASSDTSSALPSFAAPPLNEVALGVQFSPLPLNAVRVGKFHVHFADDYPSSMDVPPLPPSFETFGPVTSPTFSGLMIGNVWLPRSWFVSQDDEHIIQIQQDRLLANWRFRDSGKSYPRYSNVRARFVTALERLDKFVTAESCGVIRPNQCDATYYNRIVLEPGMEWGDLGRLLRGINIDVKAGWPSPFSEATITLRKVLLGEGGPFGRLIVECQGGFDEYGRKAWMLNISVKGRPSREDIPAVLDFLDSAHAEIVNCFASITTDEYHEKWRRLP